MKGLVKQSQCLALGPTALARAGVKKDLTLAIKCGMIIVSGWQAFPA